MVSWLAAPLRWVDRPTRPVVQWVSAALQPRGARVVVAATADTEWWESEPTTVSQRQELFSLSQSGEAQCKVLHDALLRRMGDDSASVKIKALKLVEALCSAGGPPFRALCAAPGGRMPRAVDELTRFVGEIDQLRGDAAAAEVRGSAAAVAGLLSAGGGRAAGAVAIDIPSGAATAGHRITGSGALAAPAASGGWLATLSAAPGGWLAAPVATAAAGVGGGAAWLWRAAWRRGGGAAAPPALGAYPAHSAVHKLSVDGFRGRAAVCGGVEACVEAALDPAQGSHPSRLLLEELALRCGDRAAAATAARMILSALQPHHRGRHAAVRQLRALAALDGLAVAFRNTVITDAAVRERATLLLLTDSGDAAVAATAQKLCGGLCVLPVRDVIPATAAAPAAPAAPPPVFDVPDLLEFAEP